MLQSSENILPRAKYARLMMAKDPVEPANITEILPEDILKMIFKTLRLSSYRFLAPVCRQFRDVYLEVEGEWVEKTQGTTMGCLREDS